MSAFTVYATFNLGINIVVWLMQLAIVVLLMGCLTWLAVAYAANAAIKGGVRCVAACVHRLAGGSWLLSSASAGLGRQAAAGSRGTLSRSTCRGLNASLGGQAAVGLTTLARPLFTAWAATWLLMLGCVVHGCLCREAQSMGTSPMALLNNATTNYTNVVAYYNKQVGESGGLQAARGPEIECGAGVITACRIAVPAAAPVRCMSILVWRASYAH